MRAANAPESVSPVTVYQTYAQHALKDVLYHLPATFSIEQHGESRQPRYATITPLVAELLERALTFSLGNGHRPRRAD